MQMQMPMEHHHHGATDPVSDFLMQQGSGTATNPAAAPMHMLMTQSGDWMLSGHANVFVNVVHESGPRGDDQLFSTNWFMGSAQRKLGDGQLLLRGMLSLEPVMGQRGYPELFQTGETAHGVALIDRQHPHDFFMELAAEYARDFGNGTIGYVYAAPVGDPALGPVAYPHRASAAELPQATLAHHLEDSTHIADGVLTFGAKHGEYGFAFSGFHGAEPDENRWNIDRGGIDSWAMRATWDPSPNWSAQISTGHLRDPERLEPGNVQRSTASVSYANGAWSSSVIAGSNHRSDSTTVGITAETVWQFNTSNYLTARAEIADKELPERARIAALTGGYTKDLYRSAHLLGGIGGNVTIYGFPSRLKSEYGDRPVSAYLFARLRLH
jgi:hypothetical protein